MTGGAGQLNNQPPYEPFVEGHLILLVICKLFGMLKQMRVNPDLRKQIPKCCLFDSILLNQPTFTFASSPKRLCWKFSSLEVSCYDSNSF